MFRRPPIGTIGAYPGAVGATGAYWGLCEYEVSSTGGSYQHCDARFRALSEFQISLHGPFERDMK